MPEINKVGVQPPINEQSIPKPNGAVEKLPAPIPPDGGAEQTAGRGTMGQPVGVPLKVPLTQNMLMPEVVTGRDATQLIAAEKMRVSGGASATDVLLGLNQQPSVLGGLLAPPGNLEALRHLSPAMRRKILRTLLAKQKNEMRRLVAVARDDEQHQQQEENQSENQESNDAENFAPVVKIKPNALGFHNQRVYQDLSATTKMLDLLDELLNMQDYTLSQMGTFAQG
ncbi:MAG: hypothetical protein M3T96_02030 [Acidobacteriota bacterium]|nr:hypothetical protein [Acidobacteriota bacterium]